MVFWIEMDVVVVAFLAGRVLSTERVQKIGSL